MRRKTTAIILILIIIAIVANSIADDLQNNTYTIGSIITLGQYEQDNNEENGPEEIEWILLLGRWYQSLSTVLTQQLFDLALIF